MRTAPSDILRSVGDRYLLLLREQYLDAQENIADYLRRTGPRYQREDLHALLSESDWRPRILGIHFVMALRQHDLATRLGGDQLLCGRFLLVRRPAILALAVLRPIHASSDLLSFLRLPLDPDAFDDIVAAVAALEYLNKSSPTQDGGNSLAYLRAIGVDDQGIAESRLRFTRAYEYWGGDTTLGEDPDTA